MAAFDCLRTAQTKRRRPEVEYLVDMGADTAAVDNTEELAAFHRSSLATPGDVASSDFPWLCRQRTSLRMHRLCRRRRLILLLRGMVKSLDHSREAICG